MCASILELYISGIARISELGGGHYTSFRWISRPVLVWMGGEPSHGYATALHTPLLWLNSPLGIKYQVHKKYVCMKTFQRWRLFNKCLFSLKETSLQWLSLHLSITKSWQLMRWWKTKRLLFDTKLKVECNIYFFNGKRTNACCPWNFRIYSSWSKLINMITRCDQEFMIILVFHIVTGESNVYTIGNIGPHKIVSTKLPQIGRQMAAQISSGNTTTRLLG